MAFGFPPKYREEFSVVDLTTEQLSLLVLESLKILEWDLVFKTETTYRARTKFSMSSWSEDVKIDIVDHQLKIESKCNGSQLLDWGKNRKNIESFQAVFKSVKSKLHDGAYENQLVELKNSLQGEADTQEEKVIPGNSEKGSGILSFFTPSKGYYFTPILINLNLALFIAMSISGVDLLMPESESLLRWGANFRPLTLDGEWWRLITSCFLHIGIFHLLFNMYALVYVGLQLEPIMGKYRFLSAYLLSGILASLTSLYWNEFTISAGASGAIFGMYGVFLALLTTNIVEKAVRKSLLTSILVFVGYNLLNGANEGIDNAAHIGGLVSGLVIGYAFYPSIINPVKTRLKNGIIGLLSLVTLVLTILILSSTEVSDLSKYEDVMKEFAMNEEEALGLYNMSEGTTNDEYQYEISSVGLPKWKENLKILESANELDLPEEIVSRNKTLMRYCNLRIEIYELIYKSFEEDTEEYQSQIERCNSQIEEIFKELGTGE